MKPQLIRYARAGHAGLYLCTPEETRAEAEVMAAAEELARPLHVWSATEGFVNLAGDTVRDCPDPIEALGQVDQLDGEAVVLLWDFGAFLEDKDPILIRKLRDTLRGARSVGKLLVILGVWKPLPSELEREITRLDLALPDTEALGLVLDGILRSAGLPDLAPEIRESASDRHTGAEIEAAFVEALHLAFARDREPTEFDLGEVLAQSVPLATTMSEPIDRLRHWSQGRAHQATSADRPRKSSLLIDIGRRRATPAPCRGSRRESSPRCGL